MQHPEHQRRAYLQALGIDVWLPRDHADVTEVVEATTASADVPVEAPGDWQALRESVEDCTRCSLHEGRTQTVFGTGNSNASWMVIGEAPGAEEDRRGEPFVGRSGQLLSEMLRAAGQSRDDVFIANILKCRPPNNRDPRPEESAECRSFLDAQIDLVKPDIILAVGRIAAQLLLDTDAPVGRLRGQLHHVGKVPMVVTYHPAYLLRSPTQKRKSWDDIKLALKTVREHAA
ncbi:MAG: uracil-DNA glycosylase [Pseudomonadota bacterium]